MSVFALFAQLSKGSSDPFRNPDVIYGTAGLALALLAGAFLVFMADRWRKKSASGRADTSQELTEFRGMFERGEITAEEYAKLRERVAQRVKAPPASPTPVSIPMSMQTLPGVGTVSPNTLPGPVQPTSPPDAGKPANPPPPA
ncbi:MAG TPA: SHOCT domain-containing protein [Gemmata sp.]|nr:SHOCT domain-containing protein [Gemmata sp.]